MRRTIASVPNPSLVLIVFEQSIKNISITVYYCDSSLPHWCWDVLAPLEFSNNMLQAFGVSLILVALFSGVPFIGFGILDNTIMLTAVSPSTLCPCLQLLIIWTLFVTAATVDILWQILITCWVAHRLCPVCVISADKSLPKGVTNELLRTPRGQRHHRALILLCSLSCVLLYYFLFKRSVWSLHLYMNDVVVKYCSYTKILYYIITYWQGEYIDITFGTWLGITTMAAAAIGNMVSDVLGIT